MKIYLREILHMISNAFDVFGEFRFAKIGPEDRVFGASILDVGLPNLFLQNSCDRYGPYVYVMHVCNKFMACVS